MFNLIQNKKESKSFYLEHIEHIYTTKNKNINNNSLLHIITNHKS